MFVWNLGTTRGTQCFCSGKVRVLTALVRGCDGEWAIRLQVQWYMKRVAIIRTSSVLMISLRVHRICVHTTSTAVNYRQSFVNKLWQTTSTQAVYFIWWILNCSWCKLFELSQWGANWVQTQPRILKIRQWWASEKVINTPYPISWNKSACGALSSIK